VKYALTFAILSFYLIYLALTGSSWPITVLLTSCAVSAAGLAAVYGSRRPAYLGKRPKGQIAPFAYFVFWPYLLINYLALALFRLIRRESPYSEILPSLYLGSRLLPCDRPVFAEIRIAATLDLTAEFPEIFFARLLPHYRCIPLLDTFPPSQEQLAHATDWIATQIQEGPVYVHCALGHGRSATVVAAYLLRTGRVSSAEEALSFLQERRPEIGLHRQQQSALSTFCRNLRSPAA